jgi:hypothetical protein
MVWRELVRDDPDYQPARKNLALLSSQKEVARGKTAAAASPPSAAAVNTGDDKRKIDSPIPETNLVLAPRNSVEVPAISTIRN